MIQKPTPRPGKSKYAEITCTGKIFNIVTGFIPVREIYKVKVTGSNLSIRRAIDSSVSAFMKEYDLGACGAKHEMLKPVTQ